jgi:hypothetical protein
VIQLARDLIQQVNSSANSIADAVSGASEIVQETSLSIETVCPNVGITDLEARIGMDLTVLVNATTEALNYVMETSMEKTGNFSELIDRLQKGLDNFESTVEQGEEWMWMVPTILFVVCIVVSTAMFGVILAWKGKSGRNIQNLLSYMVLPLLIATAISCWFMVLAASMGAMVGSDACTGGSSTGSPDDTIRQVLGMIELKPNSTLRESILTYTNVSSKA